MGHQCCGKHKVKRGLWSPEEDDKLIKHLATHGHGCWSSVPKLAGLQRCGKSCRLRWINYLRPNLKRGSFTEQEERIIIDVHRILGNKWAQIAKHLPGRTDNEVKNLWNSSIKKKLLSQGLDPNTHNLLPPSQTKNYSNNNNNNNNNANSSSHFTLETSPPKDEFHGITNMDLKASLNDLTSSPIANNVYQNPATVCRNQHQNQNQNQNQNGWYQRSVTGFGTSCIYVESSSNNLSSSSSSSSSLNPSASGIVNVDNSMWGFSAFEPHFGPVERPDRFVHQKNMEMMNTFEENSDFDFDFDFADDSSLMPLGVDCDVNCLDQLIAWDI